MSSGKLDGIDITPKSFLYSTIQTSLSSPSKEKSSIVVPTPPVVLGLDGVGKRGPPTPKSTLQTLSTQLISLTPTTTLGAPGTGTGTGTGTGVGIGQGQGQGHGWGLRPRPQGGVELPQSNILGNPTSPNYRVLSPSDTPIGSGKQTIRNIIDNQGLGNNVSSNKSIQISNPIQNSNLTLNLNLNSNSSFGSSSSAYIGSGGMSVLPLSTPHPEDSLELLGASIDLHQEEGDREKERDRERSLYRVEGEDKYNNGSSNGNDIYDEIDHSDDVCVEEVTERGSISMSTRPFRVI